LTSSNEQESEYSKHSFSWKNDDGDNGSSKKFKISSDKSGSHKVHVKVDNEGCATEDDIDVEIAPNPTADFNHDGDDESLCEGESIKYSASKKTAIHIHGMLMVMIMKEKSMSTANLQLASTLSN